MINQNDNPKNLEYACTPAGFCRTVLKMDLYPWQEEVLNWLDDSGSKVALRTCNESGKTSRVVAGAVLWHMTVYPGSVTVSTAGVYRQVSEQLMPHLRRLLSRHTKFKITENSITGPGGSYYCGFSTDEPGKFEGWHTPELPEVCRNRRVPIIDYPTGYKEPDKSSLLIIVDEAKSVKNEIFEATERCRPDRFLICSSPGLPMGYFFDAFHSQAKRFKSKVVSYTECPHLTAFPKINEIEEQIRTYGRNHPLVKSMVFAEFAESGENMVFNMMDIEAAMSGLIPSFGHERRAAIDFSGGGDEQVLYIREGNTLIHQKFWREPDATVLADSLIMEFKKFELQPYWITGDNGGLGEIIFDILYRHGWDIHRLLFNGKSKSENYLNVRAEMFYELSHRMQRKEISIPRDEELKQQLSWQQFKMDDKHRIKLRPKEEMPRSPDRADTIAMLYYDAPTKDSYYDEKQQRMESLRAYIEASNESTTYAPTMLMEE